MVPPIHLKSSGVRPKVVSVTFLFHQIWHRQKACCWNQQKKMQLTCQYGLTISSKPAVGSSITFRHCVCLGACDRRFSVVSCRDRGEYHDSLKVDHKSRFFDSGQNLYVNFTNNQCRVSFQIFQKRFCFCHKDDTNYEAKTKGGRVKCLV